MDITKVLNISKQGKTAIIKISGDIGYPAEWQHRDAKGIATAKSDMTKELKAISELGNVDKIKLEIDSPGGSVAHAIAIYTELKNYDAEIFVEYVGISASAATIIGSVAKAENITIPNYVSILVHEARNMSAGTLKVHKANIKDLSTINENIAQIYSNLNGKTTKENLAIMGKNNGEGELLSPQKALELGFVGKIKEETQTNATNLLDLDNLTACGWSEHNINKLTQINNSLTKTKSMGLFTKGKKTVLNTLNFGENTLIFGELKTGEAVELAGKAEAFAGDFDFDNKKVTVENGLITNVIEVSEKDIEIERLTAENKAKDLEIVALQNVATPNLDAEKDAEIERLKAENEAKAVIIAEAKLKVSNPTLPKAEFKQDEQKENLTDEQIAYRHQKQVEANAKLKYSGTN